LSAIRSKLVGEGQRVLSENAIVRRKLAAVVEGDGK